MPEPPASLVVIRPRIPIVVRLIKMHMHVGTSMKIPAPGLIRHPRGVEIQAPEVRTAFEHGQARITNLHIDQVQKP